jgi:hypothetical protein
MEDNNAKDWEILTAEGWKTFEGVIKNKNISSVKLIFNDTSELICSEDHELQCINGNFTTAKSSRNKKIKSLEGFKIVKSIKKYKKIDAYDVVGVDGGKYLSNGVVSHNCHLLDSFWASVYPIISNSKKSKIIMASTPRDTSGLFYKLYSGSIKGENNWVSMKVPWYDVPGRDEKWKKETMGSLASPEDFLREFECIFDEIGESSINATTFDNLRSKTSQPEHIYMDGAYKVWELPKEGRIYVAGVDVAEGAGKDSTIVQILDLTNLRAINQVAVYASNSITPIEFTSKLHSILTQWGSPLLLIERDKCGAQVVDNLRKDFQYENIISHGYKELSRTNIPLGVVCHTNTKYDNVTNQRYWINTIDSVRINDMATVEELRDFVRTPNGTWKAKQDKHDDRVMSLGWALLILHEKLISKYFEIIATDDNNKPAIIRPYDWIKSSLKNNNLKDESESYDNMPIVLGAPVFNSDLSDLMSAGWKFMG